MSLLSILAAFLGLVLIAFSAAQLKFSTYALQFSAKHTPTFLYITVSNTPAGIKHLMYFLPPLKITRSHVLQVVTGGVGVAIGLTIIGLSFRSKPLGFIGTGRAVRGVAWSGIAIILSGLFFLLGLSTLVISMYDDSRYGESSFSNYSLCVAQHLSNTPGCGYNNDLYGLISIEGWTCQFARNFVTYNGSILTENAGPVMTKTCEMTRLARWWTISAVVIPIAILFIAILGERQQNIGFYEEHSGQSTEEYNKEPSFSSAESAHPIPVTTHPISSSSPISPISPNGTLPHYTFNSEPTEGPTKSAEMGGKQIMEAPEKIPYAEMPSEKHQMYSELAVSRSDDDVSK